MARVDPKSPQNVVLHLRSLKCRCAIVVTEGVQRHGKLLTATTKAETARQQKANILADLERLQSHPVADWCLEYLAVPTSSGVDTAARQPWLALLLLKWVYGSKSFQDVFRPPASESDVISLLNRIRDLQTYRPPSAYSDVSQFFRNVAFQQFHYQLGFSQTDYARQFLLFGRLNPGDRLNVAFRRSTGLDLETHLDLSLTLVTLLLGNNELARFTIRFFLPLFGAYGPSTVSRFLQNLSADRYSLLDYIETAYTDVDPAIEQYEQSPFFRYPLIRWNRFYRVVHRSILGQHLEHSVYDTLKDTDPDLFMQRFGRMFESYVERCIKHADAPYLSEVKIQQTLGRGRKIVDFAIRQNRDVCILMDAKAVELNQMAKATPNTRRVYEKTKTSILGAIEQGMSTVQAIEDGQHTDAVLYPAQEYFLIIVTFKEMYLGNGKEYANTIAPEPIKACLARFPSSNKLPMENIYFLSIADFELLSDVVARGLTTFALSLDRARNDDSGPPGTGKLVFRQHLIAQFQERLRYPQFVLDALDEPFARLEGAFSARPTTD